MNRGALPAAGQRRRYWVFLIGLLAGLGLAGCRTCPIDACHARKAHYHNGVKYRARPLWKMQYPAIGEKYKNQHEGDRKRKESDHSKSLK